MRRSLALLALLAGCVLTAACNGDGDRVLPTSTTSARTASSTHSPSDVATESPESASPVPSPSAGSVLVETSAGPDELDVRTLAPSGTDVTGRWFGHAWETDVVVIAVAGAGDAFARDRALWSWTRRPDLGGWLGVELAEHPVRRGVLSLDAVVADVTGDGDDDALAFALTGGSGACGTWSVFDLVTAALVYERDLCDGTIVPAVHPVGLRVVEAVFRPGDAHCCPSARRETVLTYDGNGRWDVFRRGTTSF